MNLGGYALTEATGNQDYLEIGKGVDAVSNVVAGTVGLAGSSVKTAKTVGQIGNSALTNFLQTVKNVSYQGLKVGATTHREATARGSINMVQATSNIIDGVGIVNDTKTLIKLVNDLVKEKEDNLNNN